MVSFNMASDASKPKMPAINNINGNEACKPGGFFIGPNYSKGWRRQYDHRHRRACQACILRGGGG
jgi:hypothetical protein